MAKKIEKHSTTGTVYYNGENKEYEHIFIRPCTDSISGCNACGRPNYERSEKKIVPTGLVLVDLCISVNGYQTSVIKLCPDCIKDLRSKLFKFSA